VPSHGGKHQRRPAVRVGSVDFCTTRNVRLDNRIDPR